MCEVLWDVLPSRVIPGVEGRGPRWLEAIPPVDADIVESSTRIGDYQIGEVLGEGQFASVRAVETVQATRACSSAASAVRDVSMPQGEPGTPCGTAVKMINKAGIVSLTTLRRVDNEIAALRSLQHEGIMKLHEVCIVLAVWKGITQTC